MDDEQWKVLTYRLALLCKNEDLSTLKTPDLKVDKTQSLDLSKKQMDSIIKTLQGPGYNITQMNLDELSKAHAKYESLLNTDNTKAIWCVVQDALNKQTELCSQKAKPDSTISPATTPVATPAATPAATSSLPLQGTPSDAPDMKTITGKNINSIEMAKSTSNILFKIC